MGQQDHVNEPILKPGGEGNVPNEDGVDSDAKGLGNNNMAPDEDLLREQRNMQEHRIAQELLADLDNREHPPPENKEQDNFNAAQHSRIDHVKLAQQFIDLVSQAMLKNTKLNEHTRER